MHVIEIIPKCYFYPVVETDGVREILASFLTARDVANTSSTCRAGRDNLLSDKIWRQKLINSEVSHLVAAALDPKSTRLYVRYSDEKSYQIGANRTEQSAYAIASSKWFGFTMPLNDRETDAAFPTANIVAFVCSVPMVVASIGGPVLYDGFYGFQLLMISPFTVSFAVVTGYPLGKKYRVFRCVGGTTNVLQKKVSICAARVKGCLKTAPQRVTSCWQAFSRGMQRVHSWLFGTHLD
jgi:hypothetical protein